MSSSLHTSTAITRKAISVLRFLILDRLWYVLCISSRCPQFVCFFSRTVRMPSGIWDQTMSLSWFLEHLARYLLWTLLLNLSMDSHSKFNFTFIVTRRMNVIREHFVGKIATVLLAVLQVGIQIKTIQFGF